MKIINESGKEFIDDFINEYSSSLEGICSREWEQGTGTCPSLENQQVA